MSIHLPLVNFNGGELSHFLDARVDIAKYATGLQTLVNFFPLPYGAILRRPGTEFTGEAKYHDKRCRLFGFNFSTTTNFILEIGQLYCRFWSNGSQVIKGSADAWVTATAYEVGDYAKESAIIYYCIAAHTSSAAFATDLASSNWIAQDILEVPLPYQESDLREIQFCPINDIIYLAHQNYPVHKIKRIADDDWISEKVEWDFPPTLDENIENITIDPSATTGTITLTASSAIFKPGHVGSMWMIAHARSGANSSYVQCVLGATNTNTNYLTVLGSWEFTTYGSWQGTVTIERLIAGTVTNEVIRTYTNSVVNERNVTTIGNEDKEAQLLIRWTSAAVAGTNPLARLEVGNSKYFGVAEITAYTSPTVVTALVRKSLWSAGATFFWAEAAFSDEQGHPRTVELHEEGRLMFAGTRKQPLRIYGSFVDDYENFRVGSNSDNSIAFRLSAKESNPIQWLISQQGKLIVGTSAEEIEFGRSDDQEALGPTNVKAIRQSAYGSSHIQAKMVNEVIMFVQRQGRKLREFVFAFEKDGWVGPDLTVLANQVSGVRSKIVELAFQQQPDATLWATVSSGTHIAAMTYERDQNVVGWSRQITDGVFESAATIYGGDDPDEVWFAVKRTINGVTKRYIERLHSEHRDELDAEDKDNFWYLDCAKKGVFADPVSSVSNLSHLEGKTVGVYVDGGTQPDQVVSSGAISLSTPGRNVLVGLRYASIAKPQKFNIQSQTGSVIGRKGRVHIATVRVYKSLGLEYSTDDENWTEVTFRRDGDPMDASPAMFTGDQRLVTDGGYDSSAELSLRSSDPFPLCILAIVPEVDYHGA